MGLFEFFAQVVEAFTHNLLKFEFGCVGIFGKSEILRGHFIDAELLHPVYVAGENRFDEIFRQYVEWHHFVIFSTHNHCPAPALKPCVGSE